jgi:hypothetical protein
VATTLARQVFSEIKTIARSDASVGERCAEASKRIDQFRADLAAPNVRLGVPEQQMESLRRTLQRAAGRHDLTAAENSVYAEALDVLVGQAR